MDQPKTRPISDNRNIDCIMPSRFLKVEQLIAWHVTDVIVTIDHLQEEEVTPKPGQPAEWKAVLYFRTKTGAVHPQGYLLSAKADLTALKSSTGVTVVGDLANKRILIGIDGWRGSQVLRINPEPPKP